MLMGGSCAIKGKPREFTAVRRMETACKLTSTVDTYDIEVLTSHTDSERHNKCPPINTIFGYI
jgi:hypothetical protein